MTPGPTRASLGAMRTIGLLAVLVVGVGCADALPGDMDGTGGSGFPPRPGVGGAGVGGASGAGGAAACDQACQVAAAWQRYVASVAAVTEAQSAYDSAFTDALTAASKQCGCGNSLCPESCPRDQTTTATTIAWQAPSVTAAQAAIDSAAQSRDALYNAYAQSAIAAGLTPKAKL